jgi:uncharacterized repeat protein (TIGR03803 family)
MMIKFTSGRYSLSLSAMVALLAACGGSRPLIGAPDAMPVPLPGTSPLQRVQHSVTATASCTVRVLYAFPPDRRRFLQGYGSTDLQLVNGEFLGTAGLGGRYDSGTAFTMTLSGKINVIYSFHGSPDGEGPAGTLTYYQGKYYGITRLGGIDDAGTVYSITPSGEEHVVYSFKGASGDGYFPGGRLTLLDGIFYGTTLEGGNDDEGTVYSVTPGGIEHVVHRFGTRAQDYANSPSGRLTLVNGTLYGTTEASKHGWGTIFSLTPSGTYHNLHEFLTREGGQGSGLYLYGGKLYGVTRGTGWKSNVHPGGVFEFDPLTHVFHMLARIGNLSYGPGGGLFRYRGDFYGNLRDGGSHGDGGIFKVTPSGQASIICSYRPHPDGELAGIYFAYNGEFYGGSSWGGRTKGGGGTIFEVSSVTALPRSPR